VQHPFQSEESAFRFVWLTIGCATLVVVGAFIDKWVGLAVFSVETLGLIGWSLRRGARSKPVRHEAVVPAPGQPRKLLVVANETVGGQELLVALRRRGDELADVLVVSPALNSPLRHWTSDEDGARAAATERLEASLQVMRDAGINACGEIGDADPLQAIEDALRTFAPDELVISTHPRGRSNWLERDLIYGVHQRFALPVTHVIVDLDRSRALAADSVAA
jgi:hypothetical protein